MCRQVPGYLRDCIAARTAVEHRFSVVKSFLNAWANFMDSKNAKNIPLSEKMTMEQDIIYTMIRLPAYKAPMMKINRTWERYFGNVSRCKLWASGGVWRPTPTIPLTLAFGSVENPTWRARRSKVLRIWVVKPIYEWANTRREAWWERGCP